MTTEQGPDQRGLAGDDQGHDDAREPPYLPVGASLRTNRSDSVRARRARRPPRPRKHQIARQRPPTDGLRVELPKTVTVGLTARRIATTIPTVNPAQRISPPTAPQRAESDQIRDTAIANSASGSNVPTTFASPAGRPNVRTAYREPAKIGELPCPRRSEDDGQTQPREYRRPRSRPSLLIRGPPTRPNHLPPPIRARSKPSAQRLWSRAIEVPVNWPSADQSRDGNQTAGESDDG